MQTTKPFHGPGRSLAEGVSEGLATSLLRVRFVEAGGNPDAGSPNVLVRFESLQVPSPLEDFPARGKDTNEPERIHSREWFRVENFACMVWQARAQG
jgi:hypothetical protein